MNAKVRRARFVKDCVEAFCRNATPAEIKQHEDEFVVNVQKFAARIGSGLRSREHARPAPD